MVCRARTRATIVAPMTWRSQSFNISSFSVRMGVGGQVRFVRAERTPLCHPDLLDFSFVARLLHVPDRR
jgi:hypothetical protein